MPEAMSRAHRRFCCRRTLMSTAASSKPPPKNPGAPLRRGCASSLSKARTSRRTTSKTPGTTSSRRPTRTRFLTSTSSQLHGPGLMDFKTV